VDDLIAIALLIGSLGLVGVAVWVVRPSRPTRDVVISLAVAGAGLGVGALMLQRDVGVASWVVAPLVMAGLTIAHTMAMIAGDGPLRTD
jgi:hypothetical protein